jgi:hypothetical protein
MGGWHKTVPSPLFAGSLAIVLDFRTDGNRVMALRLDNPPAGTEAVETWDPQSLAKALGTTANPELPRLAVALGLAQDEVWRGRLKDWLFRHAVQAEPYLVLSAGPYSDQEFEKHVLPAVQQLVMRYPGQELLTGLKARAAPKQIQELDKLLEADRKRPATWVRIEEARAAAQKLMDGQPGVEPVPPEVEKGGTKAPEEF